MLEEDELIKIDPYLQYQYGDNSFFSTQQKKQVVEAIRDYSQNDPYFYRKGFSLASKSFYESGLDTFLIAEYRKCKSEPNHYLFFLSDLLTLGSSGKIRKLAKDVLEDERLEYFYKEPFINVLKDEPDYHECRDEILRNLIRANKDDLDVIQEGNEGHNRVDMRLVNKKGRNYTVQVECKRDLNAESLYSGLTEQLIDKYFTSGIYLGICLVFCFKKDPETLQKDIEKKIPYGFEKKVAVICIDLRNK
ncbi:hypothetical protein [Fibrobacter sp. UWB13]|uniref:hypothetical protein n=1 Tax=Fibrobacter sp. UWB13 TaxID=1896204 RepID=UPI000A1C8C54|nr:hypothetical protein [Fibrobacter sp. UWB13]